MPNQSISKSSSTDKDDGIIAARQELNVLDALAHGVSAQIVDLSRKPQALGQIDNNDLALIDNRYARLKAYQELAHRVYGRTVIGADIDENDRPKSAFTYRITQANIGFVEKGCVVLARNSRLATALVTAQPDDEREIETPTGERYLKVREVRTLDGPVSLRSPNEEPNFRSMAIRRRDLMKPIVVDDLRAAVQRADLSPDEEITELASQAEPTSFDDADPTWLVNWTGIYLGEADNQALGHQFITRTTIDQERALSDPRGLTFVEGVAGAGKTSVALGRLKFFANFETGAERDNYGLQNASEKDFAPTGMMGFVLSHSLKSYLKETADALELIHLPIKDFEEFKVDLSSKFGITERFRKKKGGNSSLRARIAWLRALDVGMARAAGIRLRENISKAREIPTRVAEAVKRLGIALSDAEVSSGIRQFYLSELATRVVGAISEAELREAEDRAREKFPVLEKMNNERRRIEERNLDRELRRIQQQAERKLVSSIARTLLVGLTSQELFLAAVTDQEFSTLIRDSFGASAEPPSSEILNGAIAEIRSLLSQGEGRPSLPECDLVTLVIFAGMIAEAFEYKDQSGNLTHLFQMRRNMAVFIDEVQDFTEIEIVLMGMSATNRYNQITLSGDPCQQLQSSGANDFQALFPWIPRLSRNNSIFLDHNFRQRPELAALSSGFRSVILGDSRIQFRNEQSSGAAMIYRYSERNRMVEFIISRVRSLPHRATIAVIAPTVDEAQIWFDLLDEHLSAYHRPALMSRRGDLTKRVNIHFTEVRETKGLEFDAVIIPDLIAFELDGFIGRNQVYVAFSRARQSLLIGCASGRIDQPEIGKLQREGLVAVREVPSVGV